MKNFFFTALFAVLSWSLFGQSNTVSGGGTSSGGGGSSTYTIGQIDYSNTINGTGSINQGVQQPFEFYKDVGLEEISSISMFLYPNPTSEWVILKAATENQQLSFQLIDASGKEIISQSIYELETAINMKNCSAGMYHLIVSSQETIIQSFKIIKH